MARLPAGVCDGSLKTPKANNNNRLIASGRHHQTKRHFSPSTKRIFCGGVHRRDMELVCDDAIADRCWHCIERVRPERGIALEQDGEGLGPRARGYGGGRGARAEGEALGRRARG